MNGVNLEFCIQSKLTRLNLYSFLSINVLCEISLLCGSDQGGFYFQLEKQQKDLWPLVPKYDSWIEDWTFLSPSVSPTIVNSYIFLNRSVVDLQGINTYCTAKWYSNTHTHTHILFHYSLSQDISPFHREYSSLWYTVGLCCLFILYVIVCICWPQPPNPSLPNAPPTLTTTGLFSMSVVNSHVFKSHSGLTSDCDCRDNQVGCLPLSISSSLLLVCTSSKWRNPISWAWSLCLNMRKLNQKWINHPLWLRLGFFTRGFQCLNRESPRKTKKSWNPNAVRCLANQLCSAVLWVSP